NTPAGMSTSIALGTVLGATVQWGSVLAVAQTPKLKDPGVLVKLRAWSGEKPSCPVSTTVNPQPEPGVPRLEVGTLKVIKREIALALMLTVPTVVPCALM